MTVNFNKLLSRDIIGENCPFMRIIIPREFIVYNKINRISFNVIVCGISFMRLIYII